MDGVIQKLRSLVIKSFQSNDFSADRNDDQNDNNKIRLSCNKRHSFAQWNDVIGVTTLSLGGLRTLERKTKK